MATTGTSRLGPPEHFSRYEPYEPLRTLRAVLRGPRRRRATPNGTNGANPTHHPISRSATAGQAPSDEPASRRAPNAGVDHGRHAGRRPNPGSTTSKSKETDEPSEHDRISRGSANTNVSWAVVTGCTTS